MSTPVRARHGAEPDGSFVRLDGEPYYRIAHSDRMPPFLMTIASDSDLWMFLSSMGGLTAGRVDPDGSLFPYDNVDRLHDAHHHTGPLTLIRMEHNGEAVTWQPFAERGGEAFDIEQHLYKNVTGNRVVFEERNHDLGLVFRYRWSGCDGFGHVRTAWLERTQGARTDIEVLDGLRNVLPFGASLALYQQQSSLVDAYKRSEIDPDTGVGIFSLTSKIIDRAEAAEELRANIVWCHGLTSPIATVSEDAPARFRAGLPPEAVRLRTGRRGNYFVRATMSLERGARAHWHLMADAGRGPLEIVALRDWIEKRGASREAIERALDESSTRLWSYVAGADGLQCSAHPTGAPHHFANVLFNIMRGGVFAGGHWAPRTDIVAFVAARNRTVAARHEGTLERLGDPVDVLALLTAARESGDPDFERVCLEYLPLSFGRRHGDPSRPWNRFSIRLRNADGTPALYYEGNWRDVFQNWEALAASFPRYLPGMIAKFVNASTVDGFNPYRITRDGVDWEVVDPEDPWSYIGYWGDHQIVYLLRLMEALDRVAPEVLMDMLPRAVFSYANVPYRLKSYAAMRADPHATIDFDAVLDARIRERMETVGADAQLVMDEGGAIRHATLIEKLLVTALARLSNFVPDGGIWMNTQRPEWNDANNALAGNGVSTVTLCYLRRYLVFLEARLSELGSAPVTLRGDVAEWANAVREVLERHPPNSPDAPCGPRARKAMLDALGNAFEGYRARAYALNGVDFASISTAELLALCRAALAHVDHSIAHNRREDGLYHAYHVLGATKGDELPLSPLYEMLEGQVAVLSSGALTAAEAVALVEALFASDMYDAARRSFMLYPERALPAFLEKNAVSADRARAIPLLNALLQSGDVSLVALDAAGTVRFHPDISEARALATRLDALGARADWVDHIARDRDAVVDLYEQVFRHRSFTGRSGTMYGYEGLGCIYWHMVAKLLLAVQENALLAIQAGGAGGDAAKLVGAYDRIRAGLGFEKTPAEYGAFPTDPYSHTPAHDGARQPGMTGQVKEEILTRFGELGVHIEGGIVHFQPRLIERREFLTGPRTFRYLDVGGRSTALEVPAHGLAFTLCQVPIVYHLGARPAWIRVTHATGGEATRSGDALDAATSRQLFDRARTITRIDVGVHEDALIAR